MLVPRKARVSNGFPKNMDVIVPVGARFTNKRRRSKGTVFVGRKKRRTMVGVMRGPAIRALGPSGGPRGFYGLNQGNHGPELKDIDTDLAAATWNTTGSIILINGVAQGTDFTSRIGRKFQMKSLLLRFTIFSGSTAILPATARWLVVYDKQANAAAPAVTDILDAVTTTSNGNLTNRDRFIIIYDKIHVIGYVTAASASSDNPMHYIKKYRKMKMETTNGGTGATVGSIQTGALYFVSLGARAAGTTAVRMETGSARIRFTDD